MPSKIIKRAKTNTSADVINAIRNSAEQNYKGYVPYVTDDAESIKSVGAIIMDSPNLRNVFTNGLNQIAARYVIYKVWSNPLGVFTRGKLEYGETVENMILDLAMAHQYDPETAEKEVFKRELPNMYIEYFVVNSQIFYKTTTSEADLETAFSSRDGVINLLSRIIGELYVSAEYDAYQTTKYLLARRILNGQCRVINCNGATNKELLEKIRAESNKFTFMSQKYNLAGVYNVTPKEDQYILVDVDKDAAFDVDILAYCFHMDKADVQQKKILIDGFGNLDNKRLAVLLANDPNYTEIDATEQAALNAIPVMLIDKDFFQIWDKKYEMRNDTVNDQGLYRNHFLHYWRTYATSAFSNNALFVPGVPSITSVTVSPATVSVANGGSVANFSAAVVTANYAPKSVDWSVDDTAAAAGVTIDSRGRVVIPSDVEDTTITVTATSTFNASVTDTATITVGTPV